eukprot:GCRY01005185.1.p1 GENE.GCRY01005185.1~~GCRY01005185.1.p1  ORF type:complete len:259 (-),score=36.20 GCRY01005185.1:30-806(-)
MSSMTNSAYGPAESVKPLPLKRAYGDGFRQGRELNQLRPLFVQENVVQKSDGSVYYETGNTKLVCAVYGPRQSIALKNIEFSEECTLNCELKFASFCESNRIKPTEMSDLEKASSQQIVESLSSSIFLSKYPKNVIDIYVTILENGGSVQTAVLNAAALALALAGIELVDMPTAATIAKIQDQLCVDPTLEEEKAADATLRVMFAPSAYQSTNVSVSGHFSYSDKMKAMELGTDACARIHEILRNRLVGDLKTQDGAN